MDERPRKPRNEFNTVDAGSLTNDLAPPDSYRLLKRDIERRQSLPFSITEGARLTDVIDLDYVAGAGAGVVTEEVDINLTTIPLVLAWFLGAKDKEGVIVDDNARVLSGEPVYIFGADTSNDEGLSFSWDKNTITFRMDSVNIGWAPIITAKIMYAVYYDDTKVSNFGL